jgi:uncharacterized protein YjbI with pentapeptide repeats
VEVFRQCDVSGQDWRNRRFSRVMFDQVSFQETDLRGAVFDLVVFRRCTFEGARLDGARLNNISGMYLRADDASFREVHARHVHWIGSFREADFTGSQWEQCHFYTSDLRGARGLAWNATGQIQLVHQDEISRPWVRPSSFQRSLSKPGW